MCMFSMLELSSMYLMHTPTQIMDTCFVCVCTVTHAHTHISTVSPAQ